jgi:hypothetical protein
MIDARFFASVEFTETGQDMDSQGAEERDHEPMK